MPSNSYPILFKGRKWHTKFELKDSARWTLDMNKADAQEWMRKSNLSLPVVQRILAYKNYLGSFTHVYQIQKVYGIRDDWYQSMRGHLRVPPSPMNILNGNAMQFKDWKALGIFSDPQIWNILKMKKEEGGRISWKKLVVLCDLGEEEALELKRKIHLSD
jgi:hypothetical protein